MVSLMDEIIKKQRVFKRSVFEIIMLKWICGRTKRDRIQIQEIRLNIGKTPMNEKTRESLEMVVICK